jgi:RNA polymerase sigma-70 factor, ECF subfamily
MSFLSSGALDPKTATDEELLTAARAMPWLFGVIYDRYQAAFYRKALSILRDPRDTEEVVLDTFTKIYVHAGKFEPQSGAQFSSWAYRILMNTAFTRYQKLVKDGQRFAALDPEFEEFVGERALHSGFAEREDGIERILARLPGHFAQVLRLHYLERWSHEDIAKETGENVGTIKARIHRAKAAFRKESKGGEAEALL